MADAPEIPPPPMPQPLCRLTDVEARYWCVLVGSKAHEQWSGADVPLLEQAVTLLARIEYAKKKNPRSPTSQWWGAHIPLTRELRQVLVALRLTQSSRYDRKTAGEGKGTGGRNAAPKGQGWRERAGEAGHETTEHPKLPLN